VIESFRWAGKSTILRQYAGIGGKPGPEWPTRPAITFYT